MDFFSKPFLGAVFTVFGIIIFFALIYYLMPTDSFRQLSEEKPRALSFEETLYFSTNTQSLLGMGDYYPATVGARVATMIQTLTTMILLMLSIRYGVMRK